MVPNEVATGHNPNPGRRIVVNAKNELSGTFSADAWKNIIIIILVIVNCGQISLKSCTASTRTTTLPHPHHKHLNTQMLHIQTHTYTLLYTQTRTNMQGKEETSVWHQEQRVNSINLGKQLVNRLGHIEFSPAWTINEPHLKKQLGHDAMSIYQMLWQKHYPFSVFP